MTEPSVTLDSSLPDRPPRLSNSLIVPVALALTGILGIGLVLRTQNLDSLSFWFDEACSWRISQFSFSERLDAISRDAHPPLYHFTLNGWMQLFGNGVLAARSLSVCCGLATIPAAWFFVRQVSQLSNETSIAPDDTSREFAALLAALFVAIAPLQVELSQEARPYTMGTLLALLAGTSLVIAFRRPQNVVAWIAFTLFGSALTLTHYYGLWTLFAFGVWAFCELGWSSFRDGWSSHLKLRWAGLVCSFWGIQLIWLPWVSIFLFQRERSDHQLWMPPFSWKGLADNVWKAAAGGKRSDVFPDFTFVVLGCWLVVSGILLLSRFPAKRLVGWAAVLPLVAVSAYGLAVRNILGVRYLIFAYLFLLLGVALFLGMGRRFLVLRLVGVVCFCGWLGYWQLEYSQARDEWTKFPGAQAACAYIDEYRLPDETVIFASPFVFTNCQAHLANRSNVFTHNFGDHRDNILSGPALKDGDYEPVDALLASKPSVLWTVETAGLFNRYFSVDVPEGYSLIEQQRFAERFGARMDLIVLKYRFSGE